MSYKRVIAIGDSFTRGDELADCPPQTEIDDCASASTWPALLAQSLDVTYQSCSLGGAGNQWISWQVGCRLKPDTLYVVNWSWFERFDYVDIDSDLWTTTHPQHEDKLDHYFYRNIDSDIWNLHRNLQQMHSAISLLKQNNSAFIMTCLDTQYNLTYNDLRSPGPGTIAWTKAISSLQEQVLPYIVDFEGQSFLEWTKRKHYPIGPNGHPLEKAHAEAAKYINTLVTEGNVNGYRKT